MHAHKPESTTGGLKQWWDRLTARLRRRRNTRPAPDGLIFRPVLDREGNEIGFDVVARKPQDWVTGDLELPRFWRERAEEG